MSRLLTQAEVDALLHSFGAETAGTPAGGALAYDLRAPLLLAGERLSLVQAACERLAAQVGDALSVVLAAERPLGGEFSGLVQQPAGTAIATLVQGEPLGLFVDESGAAIGGLAFQSELALAIAESLQGGERRLIAPRTLSAVEHRLLEGAFHRLVGRLDERSLLAPLRSGGLERDADFGRLAERGGMLAIAAIRLELDGGETGCRLLMTPLLASRLLADAPAPRRRETPQELRAALRRVPVTVEPTIHGVTVRVGDLRRLRPGHVLQLDLTEGDELGLRLNGALLATGVLRRQESQRLFEIRDLAPVPAGE